MSNDRWYWARGTTESVAVHETRGLVLIPYDFFLRESRNTVGRKSQRCGPTSVLTYRRDNRIATIQITQKTLVAPNRCHRSPRGRPQAPSSAMPAAPSGTIETAPVR